ncbi:MAG: DMT family transporter [Deltaproteobacteria bacterium]|jgi:drug/metabolite transporter (DMT)-like permease|nr:DMT family transporter [Deltaproteobacteria bacterium]
MRHLKFSLTPRARSLILLAAAAMLWSTSGLIIKSVDWTPLGMASMRSAFAIPILLFFNRGRLVPPCLPSPAQVVGALCLAMVSASFIAANKLTTAANAILLQYSAPVWVALAAPLFLRERTRAGDWFFISLTFGGMSLFFMDALSMEGLMGNLLAVVSGVFYAGLSMALRCESGDEKGMSMLYGNILLALTGAIFWRPPWPSAQDVLLLALAGFFQFGLPYYLFSLASRGATALEMVLLTTLEPVLNPIWVFVGLGETPGAHALLGGAVVLGSVILWSVLKSRRC